MYIKPEGQQASIHPDKADLNRLPLLKQAKIPWIVSVCGTGTEVVLDAMAAAMKPDSRKWDLLLHIKRRDWDRYQPGIQKVNVFKTKEDVIISCAATIDGAPDLKPVPCIAQSMATACGW